MVGVAQLVEPRIVIPVVVGSSPIVHPNFRCAFALLYKARPRRQDFVAALVQAALVTGR
jgi:hypothetical protein